MTAVENSATLVANDPAFVERLLDVISKEGMVDREKLTLDAPIDSLGIQSVDVVMILMAIEEEFGVYIPVTNELSEMSNVGDMINALAKHIAANSSHN